MLRLSVIVPATDGPLSLARCEAAIHAAADGPDELIVVSDADGGRPGPAAARNAGAARATGDVLVFVDSDVAVHPDAFTRIRATLAADPGLNGVFGSYDDDPDAGDLVSRFRNLLHHHVHQQSAGPVASFWSGLGAVRSDAFHSVGGFDEQRFTVSSMEDVELGMRLAAAGARVELDPEVRGKHLKGWTLASMVRTDVVRRGAPWIAVLMRRRELPGELNLSQRHRVAAAGWVGALGALLARKPGLALGAAATATAANAPFYVLLARRLGPAGAVAGVGLHALHYLTAAASVPVGVVLYLRGTRRAEDYVTVRVEREPGEPSAASLAGSAAER